MKLLIAPTEDFIKSQKSELKVDSVAGSNKTISLISNNGFADNDFVIIGFEGSETCEIAQINAAVTPGSDIQVDSVKFVHKTHEPIVVIRYNKRKFYGCETINGVYTELVTDGSPKAIQVDDPQGTTLEYSGVDYSYFKATYFNSETSEETDINESIPVLADETKRYCSLYQIRQQSGLLNNPRISDGRIEEKRKQAENEVNSAIFSRYTLPLSEIAPLITRITTLLAAGYIDFEEFGGEGEGVKWLGEGRALLKAIQDGRQRLLMADGTEMQTASRSNAQLSGYPNQDKDSDTDAPLAFTRNQKF